MLIEETEATHRREWPGRLAVGVDWEAKPPREDLWFGVWAPSSILGGPCGQWFRSCQAFYSTKDPPPTTTSHSNFMAGMNIKSTLASKPLGSLMSSSVTRDRSARFPVAW